MRAVIVPGNWVDSFEGSIFSSYGLLGFCVLQTVQRCSGSRPKEM